MSGSFRDERRVAARTRPALVREQRPVAQDPRRAHGEPNPPAVVHDATSIVRLQRTAGNRAARVVLTRPAAGPLVVARVPGPKPPTPGSLSLAGAALGTSSQGKPGKAVREVGTEQGYDGRLQAISVARIAKADPAAVALGTDERWHALVTDVQFEAGPVAGAATAGVKPILKELHGMPPVSGIAAAKHAVDDLSAKLKSLWDLEDRWAKDPEFRRSVENATPPFRQGLEAQKERVTRLLGAARITRASVVLGVPEADINPVMTLSSAGRRAAKVNLVEKPDPKSPGGAHNPLGPDLDFHEGVESALTIDVDQLDNPVRAQSILFHEAQHKSDWDVAQRWVRTYRTETGALFVEGEPGRRPFGTWLNRQVVAGRLTKADAEMVSMQTLNSSAYTEARANVRTFLANLQAGDHEQAEKELVAYANNLKPKAQGGVGQYASPAAGSQVQASIVADLKAAYRQMKPLVRAQYDHAVEAAILTYPAAWITALRFATGARRPGAPKGA